MTQRKKLGDIIADAKKKFLVDIKGEKEEFAVKIIEKELAELQTKDVLDTQGTNEGAEYVPAESNNGMLVDLMVRKSGLIEALLPGFIGNNLQQNQAINIIGETGRARVLPEYTTGPFRDGVTPNNTLITDKVLANSKILKASIAISTELMAFSVVDIERRINQAAAEEIAQSIENSMLNADSNPGATGNINSDDQAFTAATYLDYAGADDDMYNYDKGIRKGVVDGTLNLDYLSVGSITGYSDITSLIKLVPSDFNPDEFVLVMDHKTYATFMSKDDFAKYINWGTPNQTNRTSRLPMIGGMPVVVSKYMRLSDSDGKVNTIPGAGGTDDNIKGTILLAKRNVLQRGFTKPIEYLSHRVIARGTMVEAAIPFAFVNINKLALSPTRIVAGINVTV